MQLASFANLGILPRSGGLENQRFRDVQLIQIVRSEISRLTAPEEKD